MKNKDIEKWNSAADIYAEMQEENKYVRVNKRVVTERFPDLSNKRVLDLGSGYGWYTDYFSSVGADVVGCDGSVKMIEIAKEKYPHCRFDCADIEKKLPYENDSFDLVFCNQVLMDIEIIEMLFDEVYRIAKSGGIFYFSIVHPAFYDSEWLEDENGFKGKRLMEKYLSVYSFDNEFWGKTTHYHRTISKYLNTAAESGFKLVRVDEPVSYDGVAKSNEFPLFLFAEFLK